MGRASIWILCAWIVAAGIKPASGQVLYGQYTIHDLFRTIEQQRIHHADDLLPALPAQMRSHFALFFRSRNPSQAYSFQFPRIVLADRGVATEGSKLWLALAGDPEGIGYHTVEAIAAEQGTLPNGEVVHHYDFYTIEFSPTGYAPPIISPPNSIDCNSCHHGQLIWDGVGMNPRWVGAYGGTHQTDAPELLAHEEAMFRKYFIDQKPQGRYQHLVGLEGMSAYTPRTRGANPQATSLEQLNLSVESAMGWSASRVALSRLRTQPNYGFARVAILANLVIGTQRDWEISPEILQEVVSSLLLERSASGLSAAEMRAELRRAQVRRITRYVGSLAQGYSAIHHGIEVLKAAWDGDGNRDRLALGWQAIFDFLGLEHGAAFITTSGNEKSTFDFLAGFSEKVAAALVEELFMDHVELVDEIFTIGPHGQLALKAQSLSGAIEQFRALAHADWLLACQKKAL